MSPSEPGSPPQASAKAGPSAQVPAAPTQVDDAVVLSEVGRILRDELAVTRAITPELVLTRDLELDSIGLITLAVGLENRFRVKLSEEDALGIVTVADLTALVVRRVAEGGAR